MLAAAHAWILRGLSQLTCTHHQGLAIATRQLRGSLTQKQRRYLLNLDTAHIVLRHVALLLLHNFEVDL